MAALNCWYRGSFIWWWCLSKSYSFVFWVQVEYSLFIIAEFDLVRIDWFYAGLARVAIQDIEVKVVSLKAAPRNRGWDERVWVSSDLGQLSYQKSIKNAVENIDIEPHLVVVLVSCNGEPKVLGFCIYLWALDNCCLSSCILPILKIFAVWWDRWFSSQIFNNYWSFFKVSDLKRILWVFGV